MDTTIGNKPCRLEMDSKCKQCPASSALKFLNHISIGSVDPFAYKPELLHRIASGATDLPKYLQHLLQNGRLTNITTLSSVSAAGETSPDADAFNESTSA